MFRTLCVVLVLGVASGCASTTVIRSIPSGATVKNMRGEKVGKTPFTWSGSGTIGSTDVFYVEKPGYEESAVTVKKDQVNGLAIAGLAVGGLATCGWTLGLGCVGFVTPMFWMADYPPVYTVELDQKPDPTPLLRPEDRREDENTVSDEEEPLKPARAARTVSRR